MIENGQRQVAGQLLQTISGVLGVEPAQLLGQREAQIASSIVQTIGNLKTQGWDGPLDEAAKSIQSLCALYPEWAQVIEFWTDAIRPKPHGHPCGPPKYD